MPIAYAAADIVCLPSYREGFPRALVEASALGNPIVATDIAGCREAVQPGVNGDLVPVADATALADALRSLATDPERMAAYGAASRSIAESDLSEEALVDRMDVHIQRVLTAE